MAFDYVHLLQLLCWLGKVITEKALESNAKLAINMTELCELAVVRMERGWLFLGERAALNYSLRLSSLLPSPHILTLFSALNGTQEVARY